MKHMVMSGRIRHISFQPHTGLLFFMKNAHLDSSLIDTYTDGLYSFYGRWAGHELKVPAVPQITSLQEHFQMEINVEKTGIRDLMILRPKVFQDDRGFFMEVFRKDEYSKHGVPTEFVQFNHSGSVKNVVRGLHFQWEPPMGKLMRVTAGKAFLVAVDIRKGSPTLGKWFGVETAAEERILVWAPAGFARGFCVLSDYAEIQYLCTGIYNNAAESGILWSDPAIGVQWPVSDPILSDKDRDARTLDNWLQSPESDNFRY